MLQSAVFNKPLQFYGEDAHALTSKSVMLKTLDDMKNEINPELAIKIGNEATSLFSHHEPVYADNDPYSMLYFVFDVLNNHDATVVYIKYDDFNPRDFSTFGLYTVYCRDSDYPTPSAYDYKHEMNIRNFESDAYGFKVFIPQDQCTTKGKGYLALKPIEGKLF